MLPSLHCGALMAAENENRVAPSRGFAPDDPHGFAALILVESLLHGLCEKKLLSPAHALAIVESATEVMSELALEAELSGSTERRALAILDRIAGSIGTDVTNPELPPTLDVDP